MKRELCRITVCGVCFFIAAFVVEPVAADQINEVKQMEMVLIKGGCFSMGDQFGEGFDDERPVHEVCIDDYYIGKYEVTQGVWQTVMGRNPSRFQKGDDYPVENVSWYDVQKFINKLNSIVEGKHYRLPTEAEWEYACRSGGKEEEFCGGNSLQDLARFRGNSGFSSQPIGTRRPNGFGLYDMSGNVWEWVGDWYKKNYYSSSSGKPVDNPKGPDSGLLKVSRGGSWDYDSWFNRASRRNRTWPDRCYFSLGFRLASPVAR